MDVKKEEPPVASIVIPVFNEVDGIRKALLETISPELASHYEIIVVDDGSTDGTGEELARLQEEQGSFVLLCHDINRGYGAALKTGIVEASSELVVITDADNSYPNNRIPELVDLTISGDYDMVVGARTKAGAKIPLVRKPAKWVLNQLANHLAGRRIPDLNSGLRVFKKQILIDHFGLLSDAFSFTTGSTLIMLCYGFKVHYEPIEYYARSGRSKIRPIRDTLRFLMLILTTSYYFRPLRVILPPALVILLSGLSWGLYQAIVHQDVTTAPLLLVQSGVTLLAVALLSDLIVRSRSIRHVRGPRKD